MLRLLSLVALASLWLLAGGSLGAEPLFLRNDGQWDARALYRLRLPGGQVWFTRDAVLYDLWDSAGGHVLRQELGAPARSVDGVGITEARWNFIGPNGTVSDVEGAREVWYRDVRPGLSLRYYVRNGALKYDLVAAPGAHAGAFQTRWVGGEDVRVENGEIVVETRVGDLREERPVALQPRADGVPLPVECRYILDGDRVSYGTMFYDRTLPLVIDPAITLGTYIGGERAEAGRGVSADSIGNIYTVGLTRSENFPTTPGAYDRTISSFTGSSDVFVAKYDPTGTVLLFGTYIGGRGDDDPAAIRVISRRAPNGAVLPATIVVAGTTLSNDFPTTSGTVSPAPLGRADGFLLGLSPNGQTLLFSTLVGGEGDDIVTGLEVGNFENLYLCGWTRSVTLPTTANFVVSGGGGEDAFVARYSARADTLKWMVRYGGAGNDHAQAVTVDPGGAAWVTGWTQSLKVPVTDSAFATASAGGVDGFVLRIRFNGIALDYGTMIGGIGDDVPAAIAIDTSRSVPPGVTVVGRTTSPDYPALPSGISSTGGTWLVSRFPLNPSSQPTYSRTLGVQDGGGAEAVAVESNGEATIAGTTTSLSFPTTADATLITPRGLRDLAVVRLSANGTLIRHAAVLGGSAEDSLARSIVVQRPMSVVLAGTTFSPDLPFPRPTHDSALNTAGSTAFTDAFLLRYAMDRRPAIHALARRMVPAVRCDSIAVDTLTVYNRGDAELAISSHRFVGGGSGFTIVAPLIPTPPLRVPAGDSLRYVVRVRFTTSDILRDTLEITSNDPTPGKQPLRIAYEAVRAPIVLQAPSIIGFPSALICAGGSSERQIGVQNAGRGSVTVTSLDFTRREGSFTFVSQPNIPLVLGEGVGFTMRVLFRPATRGLHRDTLILRIAECSRPLLVPLFGSGDSAALILSPHLVDLGALSLCRLPVDTSITILNSGDLPVILSGTSQDTNLVILAPSFPDTLPIGSALSLRLRVQGDVPGPFRSVVQVQGNACGVTDSIVITGLLHEGPQVDAPARLALDTIPGCGGDGSLLFDTSLVVVNRGVEALTIDTLSLPPSIDGSVLPLFPLSLTAGDSVRLPIRLRGNGQFDATAQFTAEASGCTDTFDVRFDGVLVRALPTVSPTAIALLLQECDPLFDTTVTVANPLPVALRLARAESGGALTSLDTLPLLLPPHGSIPLRLRFVPTQSGTTSDTLLLITEGCGDTVRVVATGDKRGAVVQSTPQEVHLSLLACEGDAARTVNLLLRNTGDGPSTTVQSASIVGAPEFVLAGDPTGGVIAQGGELPVVVRYTSDLLDTTLRGELLVVLAPCGDTLHIPLDARLESLPVVALKLDLGDLNLGDERVIDTVVVNPTGAVLHLSGGRSGSPSLGIDSITPAPPSVLGGGESLRIALRLRPTAEGNFSDTVWMALAAPCVDSFAVVLEGRAFDTSSTLLDFCINDAGAGSAGDTVAIRLDGNGTVFNPDTARIAISYDAQRLLLLDVRTSVDEAVGVEDHRGTATLLVPPGALAGGLPLRLRFILLAGRGGAAHARIDSVDGTSFAATVCDREATLIVADRCLVTGVAFGRYTSLLEPVRPSPAREAMEVTWQQLEDAPTLIRLIDAAGREQLRIFDAPLPGGRYTVQVPLGDIPSGWYLLVVEAGEWRGVRSVRVAR